MPSNESSREDAWHERRRKAYLKKNLKRFKKPYKKRHTESYSSYIYKVLKFIHPNVGISAKAMGVMNSFVNDAFERVVTEAAKLVRHNKKGALTDREIQTAVRLILPQELAKHARVQGSIAMIRYEDWCD